MLTLSQVTRIQPRNNIRYLSGIVRRLITPIELQILRMMPWKSLIRNVDKDMDSREKVLVSLTTFPERFGVVDLAIKSILLQSDYIDRILLWIAQDQCDYQHLPENIKRLQNFGVEIRFCADLKSHKKYYYTMKENPKDIVITIDDDTIYPENMIENMLKKSKQYPGFVISNYSRIITMSNQYPLTYKEWPVKIPKEFYEGGYNILPIGMGGVLYPPNSLNREVFNIERFKNLAFYGDDLWLKCMALLNKTKTIQTEKQSLTFAEIRAKHDIQLRNLNVNQSNNDKIFNALCTQYPEILETLLY